jgi:hypothetical protein
MKIKIREAIKPIPWPQRKTVELVIGGIYCISFGERKVIQVTLESVNGTDRMAHVVVSSKDSKWSLYADELGLTPEQAVLHEVTF